MIRPKRNQLAKLGMALALVLALLLAIAGCGGKAASTAEQANFAKAGFVVATSALSTMAPDAKLLVVQTPKAVTSTSTPVWAYLFGSPKSDKTYVVYVQGGQVLKAAEYGKAGLSAKEWTLVPTADLWKIDSGEAYQKALAASKASAAAAYSMGFVTYVPSFDTTSSSKPFVWYVSFDPATSHTTTGRVPVDAKTGAIVAP